MESRSTTRFEEGRTLEELLAHSGWLTTLARRLVAGPAAEDLVQETWSTVLARGLRPAGEARAWLAAVMRNLVRDHRRSEETRRRREEEHGRDLSGRGLPAPEELAAALEARRLLLEALGSLPEPVRATVLLRYQDGLTSAEIARRAGVPASTIRSRLERGLEELRAQLSVRADGQRREWSLLLLPLARLSRRSTAVTAWAALAVVLGLSLTAALVVTFGPRWTRGAPTAPALTGSATEPPVVTAPVAGGAREALEVIPPAPGPGTGAEPEGAEFRVVARILDEEGRSIPGARLGLLAAGRDALPVELLWRPADAQGRATLSVPRLRLDSAQVLLVAGHAPGRARVLQELTRAQRESPEVELDALRLPPGGDVAGRVVDAQGRPLAGALLSVSLPLGPSPLEARRLWPLVEPLAGPYLAVAVSDARGSFELIGVPCGEFSLVAAAAPDGPPLCPARVEPLSIRPGERASVGELVLAGPDLEETIAGRVTSADGTAVAGVWLRLGDGSVSFPARALSRADGTFALLVPRERTWVLSARDPAGRFAPVEHGDVRSGTRDLILRLASAPVTSPAESSTPSLLRPDAPAGEADLIGRLTLGGSGPGSWRVQLGAASTQLDSAGGFRLRGLSAGQATLSVVSGYGGDVEHHLAAALTLAAGSNHWELDLPLASLLLENLPAVPPVEGEPASADSPEFLLQGSCGSVHAALLFQELPGSPARRLRVPAGRWTLSARSEGAQFGGQVDWDTLREFELGEGEELRLDAGGR